MEKILTTIISITIMVLLLSSCRIVFEDWPSLHDDSPKTQIGQIVDTFSPEKVEKPVKNNKPTDILIKHVSGTLNVRSNHTHHSDLVCKINNFYTTLYFYGEVEEGLGSDNKTHSWYKIYVNNDLEGWVRSDLVISQNANMAYPYESDNEGGDYVKYTNGNLNVRSKPTHYSDLVGTVTDCETLIHSCFQEPLVEGPGSDGEVHEWARVIVNSDIQGWVRYDLIIPRAVGIWCDGTFIKNVSGGLNLRTEPTHYSDLAGTVESTNVNMYYYGKSAQGLGSDDKMHTWFEVQVSNSLKGWVRSDLIKAIDF